MLKHMKIGTRLSVSIGMLVLSILAIFSLLSVYQIRIQSSLTEQLYRHSLTVSNAVRDMAINIVKMHRSIKDVALAIDQMSLEEAVHEGERYEKEAYEYFNIIEDRFLGDIQDVENLKQAFIEWKPIRDEVIELARNGRNTDAVLIMKGKGLEHIEALEENIRFLTDFAQNKADEFLANTEYEAQKMIVLTVFFGFLLFLLGTSVALLIARTLTSPLENAVRIADQVSEGNLDVQFQANSPDEIGQLLSAMQRMVTYIQQAANVAKKISKKDLQVQVQPQSKNDLLNHSLRRMIDNLQQMMEELQQSIRAAEEQNWLKEGANQLNVELSGELSLSEVCQKSISFVARYVEAGHGVLYVYDHEKNILELQGSFAFHENDLQCSEYHLGEGIIGQVAQEREAILLSNIPRQEHRINTATVSEAPLTTYTVPLLYNNTLYGVLELACSQELTDSQQAFIKTANRVIATSISSALQREQVQQLLQISEQTAQEAVQAKIEAQEQAQKAQEANTLLEEQQQQLQQQNEEFQQLNAQLKEQQQQLEQQREELRQQQAAFSKQ